MKETLYGRPSLTAARFRAKFRARFRQHTVQRLPQAKDTTAPTPFVPPASTRLFCRSLQLEFGSLTPSRRTIPGPPSGYPSRTSPRLPAAASGTSG